MRVYQVFGSEDGTLAICGSVTKALQVLVNYFEGAEREAVQAHINSRDAAAAAAAAADAAADARNKFYVVMAAKLIELFKATT